MSRTPGHCLREIKKQCLHKKRCNYEFNKYLTFCQKKKQIFNLYILKIQFIFDRLLKQYL
jgi:hypothetical protein